MVQLRVWTSVGCPTRVHPPGGVHWSWDWLFDMFHELELGIAVRMDFHVSSHPYDSSLSSYMTQDVYTERPHWVSHFPDAPSAPISSRNYCGANYGRGNGDNATRCRICWNIASPWAVERREGWNAAYSLDMVVCCCVVVRSGFLWVSSQTIQVFPSSNPPQSLPISTSSQASGMCSISLNYA